MAPLLMNLITLPLGVLTIPSPKISVSVNPSLSPFVVHQGEALYVGTIVIEIPDPIPFGGFRSQIKVVNEEDQHLAGFQQEFPGIERVATRLLGHPCANGVPHPYSCRADNKPQ